MLRIPLDNRSEGAEAKNCYNGEMSKIDYREHIQKDLDYYAIHSHKNTRPLSKMDGHSFAKILTKMTLIRLGLLILCVFIKPVFSYARKP